MFLSDVSIKRPVMMTMFLAALLLFGVIGFTNLPLNLMPDTKIPYVTIQTVYPGAAPEQIENQLTRPIEDEISTVSEIKNIQSYSLDSASMIIVEFELSKDPDLATQEIKDKVDLILNKLPDAAQRPIVEKIDITAMPIVSIVMGGDMPAVELSRLAETTVKDQLSRIAGVGSVLVSGDRAREIRVEFDNRRVYENSISIAQVGQILAAANLDMPGGNVQSGSQDFSVRLDGQFQALKDVADLEIPTAHGTRRLGSIATIQDSGEDVRERTIFFNNQTGERDENTVLINIVKSPEGNAVDIAAEVEKTLASLEAQLPDARFTITNDDSVAVEGTVNDTISTILLGIGLTALVMLLFLHDLRSTLIVALAMPMSIIPTFLVMNAFGMSLNLMSLMGISTAVGVLVMNSVVVLENIFRHKDMGHDRATAAQRGTAEVVVAVLASTLTNIAVFVPMATMSGIAGLFLQEFALSVAFATLFSMLISFTLTPMLASRLIPEHDKKKHPIGKKIENWFHKLEKNYGVVLEKVLHSKGRSALLIGGTLIVFVLAMLRFGTIPFEFVPAMDQGDISVQVELAQGTGLESTAATLETIERRIDRFDEVVTVVTSLGSMGRIDVGTNLASIDIKLIDKTLRESNTLLAAKIGEALSDIPGARILVNASSGMGGDMGGNMAPVIFYLQGEETAVLSEIAQNLKPRLEKIPGLINIDTSSKQGKPEIVLSPDRVKLSDSGMTVQELAVSMRAAIEGMVMTTFREGGREYDIRVMLKDRDVSGFEEISKIMIPTRAGLFPIGHFADVSVERGINQILREDKIRSIEVSAWLAPGYVLGQVQTPIEQTVGDMGLPEGYRMSWGGYAEMLNETIKDFVFVFILAVVLTYMLLAAILEKFGQPILILTTIPLSLIGVVGAFLVTGKTMNIVSMLAIVMLVGMVVNNAILILDYSNQLRRGGKGVREALLEAAPTKLKPILMTNIATMLGMLPMALGIGAWGAEMRSPMGIVSIGGLLVATFLSLFVIPAVENLIESRNTPKTAKAQD